jgi:hypothetical protein
MGCVVPRFVSLGSRDMGGRMRLSGGLGVRTAKEVGWVDLIGVDRVLNGDLQGSSASIGVGRGTIATGKVVCFL